MAPISLCDGSSSSSDANNPLTSTPTQSLLPLVEQIRQAVMQEESADRNPNAHFQLLGLIDDLKRAVESPTETLLRLIYQPPQNAALRTVMDMGIFPLLMEHSKGLSASELAEHTGAERALIVRLMRLMASLGLCMNPTPEFYRANAKTAALTQPIGRDGIPCIYDLTLATLTKLPAYFHEHAYTTPKEYSTSPMNYAVGMGQFEWLAAHKPRQTRFNSYMASRRQGKPEWFEIYPVERLTTSTTTTSPLKQTPEAVFIVDVGGNQGHDLLKFQERYPPDQIPGRRVLQDLPKVVKWDVGRGIEAMGCSFLEEQMVKGARIYYFRAIFHDWPDSTCQTILSRTVAAMEPGYSRVLIMDMVLPDTNVPLLQASLDIQMMSIGAGVERSERQWRALLGQAGLEVTGIWNRHPGMESVIEATRVA
ncbi:S-adenosyl-L-methionine-dependent methyltransferase [Aspergillus saccharolyticus JOP 1030-1]|uniref:S-adenosyl-L-methionine-dependent methyltransferase n=1 Tax=Aspergillus saccharolyticus JOP 1030-1 TaxID=1450539 RepID=A0A318ZY89_9EURO|nr:S-adenosyl-L-methionine-dependent methyltransferase [Aspergillus saccharolyticus JOP 1030-1]PYH40352.1 S-adenosyl-L-methionine-dependent methyltransferase [Aspergillus saccharolyticus JOP 1030-1]